MTTKNKKVIKEHSIRKMAEDLFKSKKKQPLISKSEQDTLKVEEIEDGIETRIRIEIKNDIENIIEAWNKFLEKFAKEEGISLNIVKLFFDKGLYLFERGYEGCIKNNNIIIEKLMNEIDKKNDEIKNLKSQLDKLQEK